MKTANKLKAANFFSVAVAIVAIGAVANGCGSSSSSSSGESNDGGTTDGKMIDVVGYQDRMPIGDDGNTAADSSAPTCPTPSSSPPTFPNFFHAKSVPGACSSSDISNYVDICLNVGGDCNAFKSAHANCVSCIETYPISSDPNEKWGPLLFWEGVAEVNVAGCMELTNPSDTSCPQAIEKTVWCEQLSCIACDPVTSQSSLAQWVKCRDAADAQVCNQYATESTRCTGGYPGATAVCNPKQYSSLYDLIQGISLVFCGGGDGGTVSSDGGKPDAAVLDARTD